MRDAPREPSLEPLIDRVLHGDREALAAVFAAHRDRLWRIVSFRIDPRLRGRVDADDVLQEAYLNAERRIGHVIQDAPEGLFVWFRMIVSQTLAEIHRRHLGVQRRDPMREQSLHAGWSADATSFSISSHLFGHLTSPSQAALRKELSEQLEFALSSMEELDREVLAMRHFEELSNRETAHALGLTEQAASARYVRALTRLQHIIKAIPGIGGNS
ncbi:MAG: sigma-70 family RNA polymerase sigma factor [Planctomycetaceae bacterium]|nr:sigma-70 family RNA polymerase sigma factor [Planctomycetaceae bacterium]